MNLDKQFRRQSTHLRHYLSIIGVNFVRANLTQARFGDVNFNECLLHRCKSKKTKFFGVKTLTPQQIKAAKNGSEGIYDDKLLAKLNSAN